MVILILFSLWQFNKVAELQYVFVPPHGLLYPFDTDRNGKKELWGRKVFPLTYNHIDYFEPDTSDIYQMHSLITKYPYIGTNALGDGDKDGLPDIVGGGFTATYDSAFLCIYESSSDSNYIDSLVWEYYEWWGTMGLRSWFTPDIDSDGRKEIFGIYGSNYQHFYIFENTADNQYDLVFDDTIPRGNPANNEPDYPSCTFVFDDFDGDGKMEFATSGQDTEKMIVYECAGPDSVALTWWWMGGNYNSHDVITGGDMDGDGKPEFIVGSQINLSSDFVTVIYDMFESTGNNQYTMVWSDTVDSAYRSYYPVYVKDKESDCGDIDGDGIDEMALVVPGGFTPEENGGYVAIFKAGGDNQFEQVGSIPLDPRWVSIKVVVADVDNDPYDEVIISGADWDWSDADTAVYTQIWKYVPSGIQEEKKVKQREWFRASGKITDDEIYAEYKLLSPFMVDLRVYNLAGQMVEKIERKDGEGIHRVQMGEKLPSGIYFLRFTSNRLKKTEKFIKIRR